jgi:hypothetical protein
LEISIKRVNEKEVGAISNARGVVVIINPFSISISSKIPLQTKPLIWEKGFIRFVWDIYHTYEKPYKEEEDRTGKHATNKPYDERQTTRNIQRKDYTPVWFCGWIYTTTS